MKVICMCKSAKFILDVLCTVVIDVDTNKAMHTVDCENKEVRSSWNE